MQNLEQKITAIETRNARVENDKAWGTSWTRRGFIAVLTYCSAVVFFWVNALPIPFLQALIPSCGYLLSTITLPPLKRWWIQQRSKQ